ncbi:hypothetical protein SAMN04488029_3157 [Reichenbachiella faecimaris]|uniref:Lipoprotein n=1 Tax=Reichenbachiella faecimaris TaxID=692418 RepID=A0A1W2GKT1_REIFA|nr:hypothetical protein [Reichenbachiella faecimaris]SMD36948.1 hypothetical protein SAMN04488029_3157 [Reichenbachiella faecimaris]
MKLKKTTCGILSLIILNSCVVQHHPCNTIAKNQNTNSVDFDIVKAKFPLLKKNLSSANSLFVTVSNLKNKTSVSSYLSDVRGDTLVISSALKNNRTRERMVVNYEFPTSILSQSEAKKLEDGKYQITYKSNFGEKSIQNLIYNLEIISIDNGQIYLYTGKLIDQEGTEVSFVLQTDPLATLALFAVVNYSSSISSKWDHFFNLCRDRYNKYKRVCEDQDPPKKAEIIHTFKRPLLEIGNFKIGEEYIEDCEIVCK